MDLINVILLVLGLSFLAGVFFLVIVHGRERDEEELHAGVNERYESLAEEIKALEKAMKNMQKEIDDE